MKKGFCTMACLGLVVALSGCSKVLYGTWRTESVDPQESTQQFKLAKVTFNEDGTYNAAASYQGKSKQDTGSYRFDGFKLTLNNKDGHTRTYGATYNSFSKKLVMTASHENHEIKATLVKERVEE